MWQSKILRGFLSKLLCNINHPSKTPRKMASKVLEKGWNFVEVNDWEPCSYFNQHIISQVDMIVVLFTFWIKLPMVVLTFWRQTCRAECRCENKILLLSWQMTVIYWRNKHLQYIWMLLSQQSTQFNFFIVTITDFVMARLQRF